MSDEENGNIFQKFQQNLLIGEKVFQEAVFQELLAARRVIAAVEGGQSEEIELMLHQYRDAMSENAHRVLLYITSLAKSAT